MPLPEVGDLVLATTWSDGWSTDPWIVGYYVGPALDDHMRVKYHVQLELGGPVSHRVYRRIGRISPEIAKEFIAFAERIDSCAMQIDLWRSVKCWRKVPK